VNKSGVESVLEYGVLKNTYAAASGKRRYDSRKDRGVPDGEMRMEKKSHSTTQVLLVDDPGLGRIQVEIEAFFDFSFWLAEELEDLVANWAHKAAPRSSRQTWPMTPRRS
jgi:hypothetical protein